MAFRRKGGASWYFQARAQHGYRSLSTGTTRKALAHQIEKMWRDIAAGHRAWDLLDAVLEGRLKIGELYDHWTITRGDLEAIRRDLADVDLAASLPDFLEVYGLRRPKAVKKKRGHLRWLLPDGQPLPRSRVTRAYLTERPYAYRDEHGAAVCSNTLRRVHSAWSVFFDYLTEREIFEANPMAVVKPPKEQHGPVEFYELDTVKRLVAGAPTPELRGALALAYGAGVERGALLTLRREQICEPALEVRAIGTKAHQRNRAVQLDRWALPFVAELLRDKTPAAYLLPDDWREDDGEGLSRAHERLVAGLELTPRLTLHHARHHWAATHLRAGVPVAVVQHQLGHSTPGLTLQTYGAFIPQGQDRAHWPQVVEQDQERRKIAGLQCNG